MTNLVILGQQISAHSDDGGGGDTPVVAGAKKRIVGQVVKWEGVSASLHRFGGTEFSLGRRELGHMHGDYQADIVFPMDVRNRLVEGRTEPHHILPRSGWITFGLKRERDVESAVELLSSPTKSRVREKAEPHSELRSLAGLRTPV